MPWLPRSSAAETATAPTRKGTCCDGILWLQAVPSGRGCLCLKCLARRLGRPLVAEDFGELPHDRETGEVVELSFALD